MPKIQTLKISSFILRALSALSFVALILPMPVQAAIKLYSFKGLAAQNSEKKMEIVMNPESLSEAHVVAPEFMQTTLLKYINESVEVISPGERLGPQKWKLIFDLQLTKVYPTFIDYKSKGLKAL